jgi:hypothetical protein
MGRRMQSWEEVYICIWEREAVNKTSTDCNDPTYKRCEYLLSRQT